MDLFDAISTRHSYRGAYQAGPVPRAELERIVQAGIDAPSGKNRQTTAFVIVDAPEAVAEIRAVLPEKPMTTTAPAWIVCAADPTPDEKGLSFAVEDCAAAVENMLLAITALGYASVWLDGVLRSENRAARIGELLGIPAPHEVRILLPVGMPAETAGPKGKKPFGERAHWNRFGA